MRDVYVGYYRPSEEEFKRLWQEGTVVLDTNVLLNLYRVSQATRDEVFDVLRKLDGRLWLPYQVGLEFHQRRLAVIRQEHAVYRKLRELVQRAQDGAEQVLQGLRKDSVVDVDHLRRTFRAGLGRIRRGLDAAESSHPLTLPGAIQHDPVLDTVSELFAGRTGGPPTPEQRERHVQEARQRISDQVPPGYADAGKGDGGVGDALLWRQLLDWAKDQDKPVLLVTDDQKEDWYRKEGSTTVGPRPELVAEMRDMAGVDFHLYTLGSFLQHARRYLLARVSERALDEVREVGEEQERAAAQRAYRRGRLEELLLTRTDLRAQLGEVELRVRSEADRRDAALAAHAALQAELDSLAQQAAELDRTAAALGEKSQEVDPDAVRRTQQQQRELRAAEAGIGQRVESLRDILAHAGAEAARRHDQLFALQNRLGEVEVRIAELQALGAWDEPTGQDASRKA